MKKGQLFSMDAITATALFLLMIGAVMLARSSIAQKIDNTVLYRTMEQKAELVNDALYKNITRYSVFDEEKTLQLFQKNYSQLDQEYDIGFNYSLKITDASSNQVQQINGVSLSIGQRATNPVYLISSERFGYLNGKKVKMTMKVYYYEG